jgi:fimbrial chaperone protein
MTVSPLSLELSSSGSGAKSSLRVSNSAATPIPVEVQVARISLDENGKTLSEPAPNAFLIYPPQKVIPAGGSQTFRVQWVGAADIKQSETYILSVNQLPVNLATEKSGVEVVYNFAVVVNVAPPGAQSSLKAIGSKVVADQHGRHPLIIVKNLGNRHAFVGEGSLRLTAGKWAQTVAGSELRESVGLGLVQPGKTRHFLLKTEIPPQVSAIEAEIRLPATN